MIPFRKIPQRELVVRLRPLIDSVADPEHRVADPETFAMDYHRLMTIIENQRDECFTNYALHNIGKGRAAFLAELIEGEDES